MKSLSAVILTRNRPEICLETVRHTALALQGTDASILVINNAGKEITLPSHIAQIPIRSIRTVQNMGSAARNLALNEARLLLMLDDDARISAASVTQACHALHKDNHLAAVSFRVVSPSGTEEACLLSTVFHGCACLFRAEVLREIGGYPSWCLYYGEEYDVTFRLYQAGYRLGFLRSEERILHLRHPAERRLHRIIRFNILHNVTLWVMMFPWRYVFPAIMDTLHRYARVARRERATRGFIEALWWLPVALWKGLLRRRPLDLMLFRQITLLDRVNAFCEQAVRQGYSSVVVCGVGKFPSLHLRDIRRYGLKVACFLDTHLCWKNASVSGVPVMIPALADQTEVQALRAVAPGKCLLTGTASVPDSLFWAQSMESAGLSPIIQDGWAKNTDAEIIDLLEAQPMAIFATPHSFVSASRNEYYRATFPVVPLHGTASARG